MLDLVRFKRFEDVFKRMDGGRLDEVRLLLCKLCISLHEKYVNSILQYMTLMQERVRLPWEDKEVPLSYA